MFIIHSIVQAKNLSFTIVSSLSLKPHIPQVLSLTIPLCTWPHLSSPFSRPNTHHLLDLLGYWLLKWTPFIIHPTPMVVFLKPKLTYFKKQKLDILWHSAFATLYSTLSLRHQLPGMILKGLRKLLTYTKDYHLLPWTYTLPTGYGLIFHKGQSILSWFFQNITSYNGFLILLCCQLLIMLQGPHASLPSHPSAAFPDLPPAHSNKMIFSFSYISLVLYNAL